jgi:hypothetical protein
MRGARGQITGCPSYYVRFAGDLSPQKPISMAEKRKFAIQAPVNRPKVGPRSGPIWGPIST